MALPDCDVLKPPPTGAPLMNIFGHAPIHGISRFMVHLRMAKSVCQVLILEILAVEKVRLVHQIVSDIEDILHYSRY